MEVDSSLVIVLLLMLANLLISMKGFNDAHFQFRFLFRVDPILIGKQYIRLISSGFLHVNWLHLIVNMYGLYLFGESLILDTRIFLFLIIYFVSLLGGNLLTLLVHRNHPDYSALGASGAISGLAFAFIALNPNSSLGLLFIPIFLPGWIFGLAYVIYSIWGIRSQKGLICHEGHLGGGIAGLICILIFYPELLIQHPIPIATLFIPSALFILLIIFKPHYLLIQNTQINHLTMDEKFNLSKIERERELNKLLDRINKVGLEKLSEKEKDRLEELSK